MTILSPLLTHPVPHRELAKEAAQTFCQVRGTYQIVNGASQAVLCRWPNCVCSEILSSGPTQAMETRPQTIAAIIHTRAKPPAPPSRTDDLVREVMRRTRRPLYEAEYNPCPMVGPDWWGRK